jgi:hypothetical protein
MTAQLQPLLFRLPALPSAGASAPPPGAALNTTANYGANSLAPGYRSAGALARTVASGGRWP